MNEAFSFFLGVLFCLMISMAFSDYKSDILVVKSIDIINDNYQYTCSTIPNSSLYLIFNSDKIHNIGDTLTIK